MRLGEYGVTVFSGHHAASWYAADAAITVSILSCRTIMM
jgi:hypothetical protein